MDVLPIGALMRLFELLPSGPTRQFIQTLALSHHQSENRDMGTSLRMAMTRAFSMARHQNAMLAEWGALDGQLLVPAAAPTPPPPPSQPALCGQCQEPIVSPCRYNDVDYCSSKCCHDAGDRNCCRPGVCGCTAFAIKRRQLRKHRQQMRVMQQLIADNDLEDELDDAMEEDGSPDQYGLGIDSEMDEGSDREDPMVTQANEIGAVSDIVQLSRNMVELAELRRGQKRARSEDQGA